MSVKTINILILNGVNLDLLGKREPEIYGSSTLEELEKSLKNHLEGRGKVLDGVEVKLTFFQTNSEEKFMEMIPVKPSNYDGVVMNPGAWSHTSLAIADRLMVKSCQIVEVHLSNIFSREEVRKKSITAASCDGLVAGLGIHSYCAAAYSLVLNHA